MTSKIEVFLLHRFLRDVKRLKKTHPRIQFDVERFTLRLLEGETPGDQISGVGYTTYKARLVSSDAQRGKRGGYRLIYYIQRSDRIFLLTIYSKSQRTNISSDEIRRIIDEELN